MGTSPAAFPKPLAARGDLGGRALFTPVTASECGPLLRVARVSLARQDLGRSPRVSRAPRKGL